MATDHATATATSISIEHHAEYALRLADTLLVLGHRLSEWTGQAPVLEEELALANMGLDILGQSRTLLQHAGRLEGKGRDEDALAFRREATEFRNHLLAEQPNGDFAVTMIRQLMLSLWFAELWPKLAASSDAVIAGMAAKADKETAYHVRHASEWVIRLGDGTAESHARAQAALTSLWRYTAELFEHDAIDEVALAAGIGTDARALKPGWDRALDEILTEATLTRPKDAWMQTGGRRGQHTEHLSHMLGVMQSLHRAHPGAIW